MVPTLSKLKNKIGLKLVTRDTQKSKLIFGYFCKYSQEFAQVDGKVSIFDFRHT